MTVQVFTDPKGYFWIRWPESEPGYIEGPYSDKALVKVRLREEGYAPEGEV